VESIRASSPAASGIIFATQPTALSGRVYFQSEHATHLSARVHDSILDHVHRSAREIPKQGEAGDSFQVPKEFDPFQAHRGDASSEPMMRIDPPVPAQYARNSHRKLSCGCWLNGNMPLDAATSGTLATTALTISKDQHDNVKATNGVVEPIREAVKYSRVLKHANRKENSKKEDDGA
jgi:hypothetical protein